MRWVSRAATLAAVAAAVGAGVAAYRARQPPPIPDVESALEAVRAAPHDAAAWASLGDAQSAADELRAAEEAYRTAMRLSSDDPRVLGRLGFLLYGRGEDVAALALLEQARFHGADLPMLDFTIKQLRRAIPPPAPAAEAPAAPPAPARAAPSVARIGAADPGPAADRPCTLPLDNRSTLRLAATINGGDVTLIFDTGASLTTLDEATLEAHGVAIDREQSIHAVTAVGPVAFPTAIVDRLAIAGRSVEGLTVAVCRGCGGVTGGLLGLDVMAALGMDLDLTGAQVRFRDCAPGR